MSCFAGSFGILLAAPPPELTVLRTPYDKVVAERVTAPFAAALGALNTKFIAALESPAAAAKQAGKLDDVLAIEEDKKLIAAGQPLPEDDAKTPESLKKLRAIYHEQLRKLDEQRVANLAAILPAYSAKLQELETTLTKADRIDEAKELRQYREGLGTAQSSEPPISSATVTAAESGVESGACVVWNFKGEPVDPKALPLTDMPSAKTRIRQITGTYNERAQYILAITDKGKVIGWGDANYGGLKTIPSDLTRAVQVCPSYSGAAAIDSAGRFHGWGGIQADFKKQLRFKSISFGAFHVLGITDEDKVVVWGNPKAGKEIVLPSDLGACKSVSAGDSSSMALQSDGVVWVWGKPDAPVKVQAADVRSAHWFFRRGVIVQNDGTVLLVDDLGRTGPLREVTEKVTEGGGIIGDGFGHYAIWSKDREWKLFGGKLNAEHCNAQAKGCTQVAFAGDYVFGIKPEK